MGRIPVDLPDAQIAALAALVEAERRPRAALIRDAIEAGNAAMTNTMTYKGYAARIEFDPRDAIFMGHVLGVADRITFHGETVADLAADFHAGVDHYLEDCATTRRPAERASISRRTKPSNAPRRSDV